MKTKSPVKAYLIKISLKNIKPEIWRRILVPENTSLSDFHKIIQAALGWQDSHLHEFTIKGRTFIEPDYDDINDETHEDENEFTLKQLDISPGLEFSYIYDFGDGWNHQLIVEDSISQGQYVNLPLCIGGKRACPPEDVGGIGGYEEFLQAINDPDHEEHESMLQWVGGNFDPEEIDIHDINQRLGVIKFSHSRWVKYIVGDRNLLPAAISTCSEWEHAKIRPYSKAALALPFRRDTVSFLNYIRSHKVVGISATGNLPLKNVDEIGKLFVKPVSIDFEVDGSSYRTRSEEGVWPVYFIHLLADALGLVSGCPGRRWVVTPEGEEFLTLPPIEQSWALFIVWCFRFNWMDAYNRSFFSSAPPLGFEIDLLKRLKKIPASQSSSFRDFVNELGNDYLRQDNLEKAETVRLVFSNFIEISVMDILERLGIITTTHEPSEKLSFAKVLRNFTITEFGSFFLSNIGNN